VPLAVYGDYAIWELKLNGEKLLANPSMKVWRGAPLTLGFKVLV